ncbi:succinate dehydrogenase [Vannielia litorea]|uniref:succinate dehydrogenase n=1 Tax=Vannielia TaxID=2813041 RepID=UPI001C9399B8|nr:succinate dehydrogenase [Vannielia litorea]MBY6048281.1 succinate dehydrogenase [Vannielia litorea]MBY6075695.1 succinate dehydrogenase [Vannielia litorea]
MIYRLTPLLLLLAACDVNPADVVARQAAKSVVRPIVQEKLPGVPPDLVTECLIDNMSAGEISTIAQEAATGISPRSTEIVVATAQRPKAIECITREGLPLILNG